MIKPDAKLSIQFVPLECLQVVETGKPWTCFPKKFHTYLDLLTTLPDAYLDPILAIPSPTHQGMFAITNGKHRYCSYIMAGRQNALCVIVEDV